MSSVVGWLLGVVIVVYLIAGVVGMVGGRVVEWVEKRKEGKKW